MNIMKQPELGKKLIEYRNESGLTQEQLSEKTKINIRTIQRIELGEVTPRNYTLKIILNILGKDFEDVNGENEGLTFKRPGLLKTASIAGVALAVNVVFLIILIILRDNYGLRSVIPITALLYITFIILTFFLNIGIIHAGKTFDNSFLVVTGYIGIFLTLFANISHIAWLFNAEFYLQITAKTFLILAAVNGIFYGAGLLFLKRWLNDVALIIGSLIIFQSILFIIPIGIAEVIGLVLMIPSYAIQALIFNRLQKQQFNGG
jgi:transcriptional regulator with XRE-family HTH domain